MSPLTCRHLSACKSSLIDQFIMNMDNRIDNVVTKHSFVAHHKAEIILYHDKEKLTITEVFVGQRLDSQFSQC